MAGLIPILVSLIVAYLAFKFLSKVFKVAAIVLLAVVILSYATGNPIDVGVGDAVQHFLNGTGNETMGNETMRNVSNATNTS